GGGEMASVWDILRRIQSITGRKAHVRHGPPPPGAQRHTSADTTRTRRQLGGEPRVGLEEGLARQVDWQRANVDMCPVFEAAPTNFLSPRLAQARPPLPASARLRQFENWAALARHPCVSRARVTPIRGV